MKRSRYTNEQMAFALRQAESGTPVGEVCRKMGISEQTFYRWKRTADSSSWLQTLHSTRSCCRTCCEKNSEACPETRRCQVFVQVL